MVFFNSNSKLKFVNEAFANLVGYTVNELVSLEFKELVAPEDLELVQNNYEKRLAGKEAPSSYEWRMLHKDGSPRFCKYECPIDQLSGKHS
jgi:PAS domain S-box-containing protein